MFNTISSLDPGSRLEGRVLPGDELRYINRHEIHDVLDYKYWAYDRSLTLEFRDAGTIRLRKKEGEDLGLNFETYLMDKPTGCSNRCIFCFIDQLPRGLRKTLYFKDDDARLSFLTGNYITCTNLSERELQRICDLKVSPLNISVHATDPELRAKLIGNPRGREIMDILRRFAAAGIFMECQIVAVPGWNDGAALQRSLEDLAGLYPHVSSVSIVPVGLTCHREKLTPLSPYTPEQARATIAQVESFAAECFEKYGSHIFYCSDEMYLRAGLPLPEDEYYEDYAQLENGVGMLRSLEQDFLSAMRLEEPDAAPSPFTIATGTAAAPFLRGLLEQAKAYFPELEGQVIAVENDFFGHTIDVAGLLTGQDLSAQLQRVPSLGRVLLPLHMLRHGETVFLDDYTVARLADELGCPVQIVGIDGGDLLDAMLEKEV